MYKHFLSPLSSKKEIREFLAFQKLTAERTGVSTILSLLPDSFLTELGLEIGADKWVKKLKASTLFKLLIFSQLQRDILSLRTLSEDLNDPSFQVLVLEDVLVEMGHSGIRDRLHHVNVAYFERLFEHVYQQALDSHSAEELESRYAIKRYDSTLVPAFARHIEGMRVGNTKNNKTQLKFTTELRGDLLPKMLFFKDQDHLSEETALAEMVLAQTHQANEIAVIDAGLKIRATFVDFSKKSINFIGRLTKNPRHKKLGNFKHKQAQEPEHMTLIQDSLVQLFQSSKSKPLNKTFRLVEYRLNKSGEILSFVTNALDLPPQTIAQYYRKRWDIEVFFRFIKQELDFEHFISYNENAIKVQVYTKLILAMLILIYKKKNNIKSLQKAKSIFFKELIYNIIYDILEDEQATQWFKQIIKANFVRKNE